MRWLIGLLTLALTACATQKTGNGVTDAATVLPVLEAGKWMARRGWFGPHD